MEFNKLALAVVGVVDHVDHPAAFHILDDIPSLLACYSQPRGYVLDGQPVVFGFKEEGFNVVLTFLCGGVSCRCPGFCPGFVQVLDPLPEVLHFLRSGPDSEGSEIILEGVHLLPELAVLLSEFGDLVLYGGQLAEDLHQQGAGGGRHVERYIFD